MAVPIVPRIRRGRLYSQFADVLFLTIPLTFEASAASEAHRLDIVKLIDGGTATPEPVSGGRMNANSEIAEARATAIVLRATAKVVRAEQDSLMFRLNRAADVLDSMVALAVRCLERIEQLEQELRQFRAGAQ